MTICYQPALYVRFFNRTKLTVPDNDEMLDSSIDKYFSVNDKFCYVNDKYCYVNDKYCSVNDKSD